MNVELKAQSSQLDQMNTAAEVTYELTCTVFSTTSLFLSTTSLTSTPVQRRSIVCSKYRYFGAQASSAHVQRNTDRANKIAGKKVKKKGPQDGEVEEEFGDGGMVGQIASEVKSSVASAKKTSNRMATLRAMQGM